MKTTNSKSSTTFDDHLDKRYGKKGTSRRDELEREFESFKIGLLLSYKK